MSEASSLVVLRGVRAVTKQAPETIIIPNRVQCLFTHKYILFRGSVLNNETLIIPICFVVIYRLISIERGAGQRQFGWPGTGDNEITGTNRVYQSAAWWNWKWWRFIIADRTFIFNFILNDTAVAFYCRFMGSCVVWCRSIGVCSNRSHRAMKSLLIYFLNDLVCAY